MLAAKIKRLRDTFESWSRGEHFPTEEDWHAFRADLKTLTFEVAMLELGVDISVVDVAVAEHNDRALLSAKIIPFMHPRNRGGER